MSTLNSSPTYSSPYDQTDENANWWYCERCTMKADPTMRSPIINSEDRNKYSIMSDTDRGTTWTKGSISITAPRSNSSAAKGWNLYRNRIAFFFIGLCVLPLQSFSASISARALGRGNLTAVSMLSLFLPQLVLRMFTDYWTMWWTHRTRMLIAGCFAAIGLLILYIFLDESADENNTLLHPSRAYVILSMALIGTSTTVGEVTACSYTVFFERHCINAVMFGAGFGSLLGAAVIFLREWLSESSIVLSCLFFPFTLLVSYFCLKHPIGLVNQSRFFRKKAQKGGVKLTVKRLSCTLFKYTSPLFLVYCSYNIVLAAFIGPSFDVRDDNNKRVARYEVVYPYFLFSLRLGIWLGKSSGWMRIKKFWMFPAIFSIGTLFTGLVAFAPTPMYWFNHSDAGFWILWIIGCPLGWNYGATPASVLFAIRDDVGDELREFALGNVGSAAILGHAVGNLVAVFVAYLVPARHV